MRKSDRDRERQTEDGRCDIANKRYKPKRQKEAQQWDRMKRNVQTGENIEKWTVSTRMKDRNKERYRVKKSDEERKDKRSKKE